MIVNFETITLIMLASTKTARTSNRGSPARLFLDATRDLVDEMCGRTSRDVCQMVREVCQVVCISCARRPTTHFRRPDGVQRVCVSSGAYFDRSDGHFLVAQVVTFWPSRWSFFRLFDVFFVDF